VSSDQGRQRLLTGFLLALSLLVGACGGSSPGASVVTASRQASKHSTSASLAQAPGPAPVDIAPGVTAPAPGTPLFSSSWVTAHPGPDLGIKGQADVMLDVDRHEVLWERDPSTPRAPASLTKIVTAMVAADLAPLDQTVTVSAASDMQAVQKVEPASTVMGLTAGEVLTERELMYGLFMRSGNDAAETLAAGIVDRGRFMQLMNDKAAALGMRQSHFTSPVGLDDQGMRSTAFDLAVAGAAIVSRYPQLLAISGTPHVTLPQTATHKAYTMDNYNKLVLAGPFNYAGATGMKTAFTDDAGPCMVASASRGGRRLVVVVLHSDNFFGDATKLLNYGFGLQA
jgi:D-alanyl-D-alanine carboxypeptidase (penicillin-binding protein 5/6)